MSAIVAEVKREFGIAEQVDAELYKLLIYEKGSFFAPHRDTEKILGMFATLVVGLPSRHEGGKLIVTHDRQMKTIEFAGNDAEFKTQYAAFYADCQHEIEPVTDGYRICLVYNLAIAGKKSQPSAPQNSLAVEKTAALLTKLFSGENDFDKIAIPFTHQYTEAGLDPQHLKGADRARAEVLARAAESLAYACHIALLTHWQSGGVDYNTWDFDDGWGRRRGRSSDLDVSGVEMDEVYDENMSLDHWVDPHGQKQPFGEIHLKENEVLGGTENWSYQQEVHEATGNSGATLERWYRRAVMVIWPPDRTFRILAGEGQAAALPELERMVAQSKAPASLKNCREFAEQIVACWQSRQAFRGKQPDYPARMLKMIECIGNEKLSRRFIRDVLPKDFDGSEGHSLVRLCERFGWPSFADELRSLVVQQEPTDDFAAAFAEVPQIISLCRPLFSDPPPMSPARRNVCEGLADELVRIIECCDSDKRRSYRSDGGRRGVVEGMVRILSAIEAKEPLDWFLSYVLEDARQYDLRKVLVADVKAIYGWLENVPSAQPAAERLMQHCIAQLREATDQRPQPPKDWARAADWDCKCEDCRELARFLRNPAAAVGRFPLRKERRQHLHQQIEHHQLDCTHETERKGSPQTLVCTKTQSSFERQLKQYKADCHMLSELDAVAGSVPAARPKPKRARRPLKR